MLDDLKHPKTPETKCDERINDERKLWRGKCFKKRID
jgi:hypothetical protein